VSGWLADKLAQLKLRMDDKAAGSLRLLETVEIIGLGIDGKKALWRALKAGGESPSFRVLIMDVWCNARRINVAGWKRGGWNPPEPLSAQGPRDVYHRPYGRAEHFSYRYLAGGISSMDAPLNQEANRRQLSSPSGGAHGAKSLSVRGM
jgi:hypothetical protein